MYWFRKFVPTGYKTNLHVYFLLLLQKASGFFFIFCCCCTALHFSVWGSSSVVFSSEKYWRSCLEELFQKALHNPNAGPLRGRLIRKWMFTWSWSLTYRWLINYQERRRLNMRTFGGYHHNQMTRLSVTNDLALWPVVLLDGSLLENYTVVHKNFSCRKILKSQTWKGSERFQTVGLDPQNMPMPWRTKEGCPRLKETKFSGRS